ncbi:MAG: hypothetical protein IJV00_07125, partial [Clostridia bacterium]|nr:hypothetical protein [Clostridia bacterium]
VMIPIANIQTKNKPYDKIPAIFHFEPALGMGFVPTEYVDITDFIDVKRAMCAEHQSQIAWMQDNYKEAIGDKKIDFFDHADVMGRFRGIQCGVEYAEGFRVANDAYRVRPCRLLP